MALSEHEKWIRDNIGGKKVQVNSNELWESLQSHVPVKKSKKGLYFLLIGLFILSGITVGSFYAWNDSNLDFAESETLPNQQISENAKFASEMSSINPDKNDNKLITDSKQTSLITIETKSSQIENTEDINRIINDTKPSINKLHTNTNSNHKNNISTTQNVKTYASIQNTSAEIYSSENKPLNPLNVPSKSILPISKNSLNTPLDYANVLNLQQQSDIEKNVPASVERTFPLYSELKKMNALNEFSIAHSFSMNSLSMKTPAVLVASKTKRAPVLFLQMNSGINRYYLISSSSRSEYNEVNDVRKAVTNNLPSYFSSVSLDFKANDLFTFYVGFNHSQLVDRISFDYTSISQNNTIGVNQIYIDDKGLIQEKEGETTAYVHSRITGKWHQYIQNYAWQFGFKLTFVRKNGWEMLIGSGIDYSILTKTTGSYLSDEYSIEKIESPFISPDYKRVQAHANLNINYALTKNISLGLYGEYRSLHNLISINDNTLISEYLIGNIGLSCRYSIL